jgi:hypothetical protein
MSSLALVIGRSRSPEHGSGSSCASARRTTPASAGNDPDQVTWRLRRGNEDLRRLVKIYAESIRQLTLDHLELEAKLNAAASVATLSSRRNR